MARRLIGSATTDSSGVATFSYTPTGKGKIVLVAETSDGTLESGELEVIDAYFYDNGGSSANWYNSADSLLSVSYDDGATILTSTGGANYFSNSTSSINRYLTGKWCVEFDVVSITGTPYIRLYSTSSVRADLSMGGRNINNGSHVKFTYDNTLNSTKWEIDGVSSSTYTLLVDLSSVELGLSFRFGDSGGTLGYKNLKVYKV